MDALERRFPMLPLTITVEPQAFGWRVRWRHEDLDGPGVLYSHWTLKRAVKRAVRLTREAEADGYTRKATEVADPLAVAS